MWWPLLPGSLPGTAGRQVECRRRGPGVGTDDSAKAKGNKAAAFPQVIPKVDYRQADNGEEENKPRSAFCPRGRKASDSCVCVNLGAMCDQAHKNQGFSRASSGPLLDQHPVSKSLQW